MAGARRAASLSRFGPGDCYGCQPAIDGRTFVNNIDELDGALSKLVNEPGVLL